MPLFTGKHTRHDPPNSILLVLFLLLSTNACTLKHANVTPGLIPKGKMVTIQDEKYGESLLADLKKKNELSTEDPRYDQLVTICNHLTRVAGADQNPWKLRLFHNPDIIDVRAVNGNYIFVWSGLLDVTQSEDEIAAMLAYEMAHGLTRHTDPVQFTLWSEVFFETASLATSMAILFASQGTVAITGSGWMKWLYMKAADLMPLEREYSKEEEREAAEVAYMILARSKYDPEAMVRFWKRVQGNEAVRGKIKRLNRDLSLEERVALLEALLPAYSGGHAVKNNTQGVEPVETMLRASARGDRLPPRENGVNNLLLTGDSQHVDKEPGRETLGIP
jgi:predicted Zn-dependent protease